MVDTFEKGDMFTYYNPKYPRTKTGKVMIVENVSDTHIEKKDTDGELVIRQYPIEFCTKVNTKTTMENNKRIVYSAVDNGIDGRDKESIVYSSYNEEDLNMLMNKDKSKAWRTVKEQIVNVNSARKQALAKLNGIDRLVLGLPNWIEER